MFKIATNPEFTHKVTIKTPVDGGYREDTLKVRYRMMLVTETESYDLNTGPGTVDFLKAVIVSIDDVVGDDDKPLTYNDALRDQLLDMYNVRGAMVDGYLDAMRTARVGN